MNTALSIISPRIGEIGDTDDVINQLAVAG